MTRPLCQHITSNLTTIYLFIFKHVRLGHNDTLIVWKNNPWIFEKSELTQFSSSNFNLSLSLENAPTKKSAYNLFLSRIFALATQNAIKPSRRKRPLFIRSGKTNGSRDFSSFLQIITHLDIWDTGIEKGRERRPFRNFSHVFEKSIRPYPKRAYKYWNKS